MTINTKFSIGEQVVFELGPKNIKTVAKVGRIEIVAHSNGRVMIKYRVVFDGSCVFTIPENRLVKA